MSTWRLLLSYVSACWVLISVDGSSECACVYGVNVNPSMGLRNTCGACIASLAVGPEAASLRTSHHQSEMSYIAT